MGGGRPEKVLPVFDFKEMHAVSPSVVDETRFRNRYPRETCFSPVDTLFRQAGAFLNNRSLIFVQKAGKA